MLTLARNVYVHKISRLGEKGIKKLKQKKESYIRGNVQRENHYQQLYIQKFKYFFFSYI